jgi:dTDP-4-dehydrorhamnose 3,5-epimerase
MKITPLAIKDVLLIEPRVFEDERGYFFESFNLQKFKDTTGLNPDFVQDNESKSSYGVLRGLHFQRPPYAQAKLVRVIKGKVLDVAVDIREGSPTYGQHVSAILSEENKRQLYVPRGFAHGFLVLEDETIFSYKCDNFYNKESEGALLYNDSSVGIEWGIADTDFIISVKDKVAPTLEHLVPFTVG